MGTPSAGPDRPSEALRRVRIIVGGRVQGVWFCESAKQAATALGLAGTVRNLSTGEVEIIAEGPLNRLEALTVWARRGPDVARVDEMDVEYSAPTGRMVEFRVMR